MCYKNCVLIFFTSTLLYNSMHGMERTTKETEKLPSFEEFMAAVKLRTIVPKEEVYLAQQVVKSKWLEQHRTLSDGGQPQLVDTVVTTDKLNI